MSKVLIVEADASRGQLWADHLERAGVQAVIAQTADAAVEVLERDRLAVVILDLTLPEGDALGIADVALFRQPEAKVIFLTDSDAFADGSIFSLSNNATAYLQTDLPPEDLAAIVQYHAAAR